MSESNNTKNVRDDEIDLLDLFKRLGKSLTRMAKALGRGILISIVFLFRKWLPLFLSVVLGVGASYLLKFTTHSSYTSDLVLRTNTVSSTEMIDYLNRLHSFCKGKISATLADAISITSEQTKNISDISAYWVIDKGNDDNPDIVDYLNNHNIYDTVNVRMPDRLDVRVKIRVPQELNNIRNGLIKFINSDSLFQQKNRVRLRQNQEILTRLNYDILQLDSLQKVKYFEETRNMQPKTGGQMIFLQEHNTQLVYHDIYELYARKQELDYERDLYKGITTVLSEFSIPIKRDNGGSYYAVRIVPIFFGITLLILILVTNKKKLKEVYRKY